MLRVNGLSSAMKEICNAISASQLIEEPTRITNRSSTLIDLLISTAEDKIRESGVIHTAISDHSMIYAIRKCRRARNPPRIINTRSYKTFNSEKFTDLQSADWSGIYTADNIHKATEAFTEQVQIIADKHAPRVTVRVKRAVNNIFSDELLVLMKERDAAKAKAARTRKVDDWNEFKWLRNKVNNTKFVEKFTTTVSILTCNINMTNTFRLQLIEGSTVLKQIMTLKSGKSTGLDQISVRLLKGGATVLSKHLTYLFNMSITNAEVPEMWKVKEFLQFSNQAETEL